MYLEDSAGEKAKFTTICIPPALKSLNIIVALSCNMLYILYEDSQTINILN